jgi:hypothetical protein
VERLKGALPNLIAEPTRIDPSSLRRIISSFDSGYGVPVIVSAVDNDESRAAIIATLDSILADYVLINPGNSEKSSFCSVQIRKNGELIFPSIFDRYPSNYSQIDIQNLPGSCGYVEAKAPQTITANFVSALTINWYLRQLLYDGPIYQELVCSNLDRMKLVGTGEPINLGKWGEK